MASGKESTIACSASLTSGSGRKSALYGTNLFPVFARDYLFPESHRDRQDRGRRVWVVRPPSERSGLVAVDVSGSAAGMRTENLVHLVFVHSVVDQLEVFARHFA